MTLGLLYSLAIPAKMLMERGFSKPLRLFGKMLVSGSGSARREAECVSTSS